MRYVIASLLLCCTLAAQSPPVIPTASPAIAFSEIDDGQSPGFVFGVIHLESRNVWLGPMASTWTPSDTPGNSIGNGGSTITSEWMSGNIKRTVTTRSPPGKQGRRLALSRHNDLVLEAVKYWPIDP